MRKQFFLSMFLVGVALFFLSACTTQNRDIIPEAKVTLDKLNGLSIKQLDTVECPEDQSGYIASGEIRALISQWKEELNKLGVEVRWNCTKKLYDIVTEGQTSSPVCGCQK